MWSQIIFQALHNVATRSSCMQHLLFPPKHYQPQVSFQRFQTHLIHACPLAISTCNSLYTLMHCICSCAVYAHTNSELPTVTLWNGFRPWLSSILIVTVSLYGIRINQVYAAKYIDALIFIVLAIIFVPLYISIFTWIPYPHNDLPQLQYRRYSYE